MSVFLVSLLAAFPHSAFAGLVGLYTFEGNTNDASGAGNNPTSGSVSSYAAGVNGQAAFFNGGSDKLVLPINISPGVMPVSTMGAWVKASTTTGLRAILSADDNSPANYDRQIGLDTRSNGELTGGGAGGFSTYSAFCGGSNSVLWGGQTVSTSEFTFVAVRYDGSRVTLFIGDKVFSANDTTDDDAVQFPQLWVGKNPNFDSFFHGYMDNVFVFDHAVSNAQMQAIRTEGVSAIVDAGKVGEVFTFGQNQYGQLGTGGFEPSSRNVAGSVQTSGVLAGKSVSAISAGGTVAAVTTEGKVYTWGYATHGALGNATSYFETGLFYQPSPVAVDTTGVLAGKIVTEVSSSWSHVLALTSDGKLFSWGKNDLGQLGNGSTAAYSSVPVAVDMTGVLAGKTVVAISSTFYGSYALTSDGKLYAWGHGGFLGIGANVIQRTPVAVDMTGVLAGKFVTAISTDYSHSLALTSEGKVYAWGTVDSGELGIGSVTGYPLSLALVPVAVDMTGALSGKTVTAISAGVNRSTVLTSEGKLYQWGHVNFSIPHFVPVAVDASGLLAGKTITSVGAGGAHAIAEANDGALYSWGGAGSFSGHSTLGELGAGPDSSVNSAVPIAVNMSGALANKRIRQICCSDSYSALLAVSALSTSPEVAIEQPVGTDIGDATGTVNFGSALPGTGALGNALNFGTSGSILGTGTNLPQGDSARTIEFWFKNGPTTGEARHIFSYGQQDSIFSMFDSQTLNVAVDDYGGLYFYTGAHTLGVPDVSPGKWHHVALTLDPSTARIYVDGVLRLQTASAFVNTTGNDFVFGAAVGGDYFKQFQGSLDEFRIWSTVRTQAQIQAAMNTELVGSEAGLVAYWKLNQGVAGGNNGGVATLTATTGPNADLYDFTLSGNTSNWIPSTAVIAGGGTASRTFTIRNTGVDPLSIGDVVVSDGNAGDFTVNKTGMATTIPPGGSTTFSVTFQPKSLGSRQATLRIYNSDANEGTFDITLTGAGSNNTPPTVTLTGANPLTFEAAASYTDAGATASDTEDGVLTPVITSNTVVANVPGTYSVTWTATDSGSLTGSATRTVNVVDTTAPVVAAHANVIVPATSAAGATVSYAAGSASDLVGVTSITYSQNSGTVFPIGTTTVTITALDAANNMATRTFDVTVVNTPPVVSLIGPGTVTVEAALSYTDAGATAMDAEEGAITPVIFSNNVVPSVPGTYAVTWRATDVAGASGSATRTVNVVDTTAPVVAPHANVVAEATSATGATVTYASGSASDLVGVTSLTYSKASGTLFAVGTTTVTISAADAANNIGTTTFTVTVRDTTPPVVTVPANLTVEATSAAGAVVTFSTSATDIVDGSTATTSTPASGSTFPIGTTSVNVTSTDAANNTGSASFTVTVHDTSAPVVTVPANITLEATSAAGAVLTFTTSANDLVDGATTTTASPASGSTFPFGTTTVNVTSTDALGHTGSASFTVTVRDTTGPAVTVPSNITVEATAATGSVVTFATSATDIVDGSTTATATPASGSTFPIGTTTVNVTSTDAASNTGSASFTITVRDTIAPAISVPADMTVGSSSAAGVAVNFTVSATDAVGGAITPVATPASGSIFPVGVTTVNVVASDAAGNNSAASFTVTVVAPDLSVHATNDAAVTSTGHTRVYPLANDYAPAGSVLTIKAVSDPNVEIDGRTLVVPAGYTGTFNYTTTNGTTDETADVVITAGTAATAPPTWTGLLYNSTGAIAGRARLSQSAGGVKVLLLMVGKDRGTARFAFPLGGTTISGLSTSVGVAGVARNSEGLFDVTLTGGITGTMRPSVTGVIPAIYNVGIDGVDHSMRGGGFGTVRVRPSGVVVVSVLLPDGRRLAASGELSDNGTVNIYGIEAQPKPTPEAFLGGELNIANLTTTDITGELEWRKPAAPSGLLKTALNTVLTMNGCAFDGNPGITDGPAIIRAVGGGLAAPLTMNSTVSSGKVTAVPGQIVDWLIHPATKAFRLRFFDPTSNRLILASGVYLPKSGTAVGFFRSTTNGGKVELSTP